MNELSDYEMVIKEIEKEEEIDACQLRELEIAAKILELKDSFPKEKGYGEYTKEYLHILNQKSNIKYSSSTLTVVGTTLCSSGGIMIRFASRVGTGYVTFLCAWKCNEADDVYEITKWGSDWRKIIKPFFEKIKVYCDAGNNLNSKCIRLSQNITKKVLLKPICGNDKNLNIMLPKNNKLVEKSKSKNVGLTFCF